MAAGPGGYTVIASLIVIEVTKLASLCESVTYQYLLRSLLVRACGLSSGR